jgi:hypothetical protein
MKVEVIKAFLFSPNGRDVVRYRLGAQEMPDAAAAYAMKLGYARADEPLPEYKRGLWRKDGTPPQPVETLTDPGLAVGEKQSASPAVQASPQTTLKKSKGGGRKKKAAASL